MTSSIAGRADEVVLERRGAHRAVPAVRIGHHRGAQSSFLDGADWAYLAGIVAILVGATLVFLMFPKHDEERRLLAEYHATDTAAAGNM